MLRCVHCGKRVDALVARGMQQTPCSARENDAPCIRLYDRWIEVGKGRGSETRADLPKSATAQLDMYSAEIAELD